MDASRSDTEAFGPPRKVAAIMAGFGRPWFVAGGWAIDLFLGHETRPHDDVEIAILREDQALLQRHLAGWDLEKVVPGPTGHTRTRWVEGEWLALPVHEIHARRRDASPPEVEILLNESDGGSWRFRRDPRIRRPLDRMGRRSAIGVPILNPEIVLLYKVKDPQPWDEEDFQHVVPALDDEARRWIGDAIGLLHRGHPWIARL